MRPAISARRPCSRPTPTATRCCPRRRPRSSSITTSIPSSRFDPTAFAPMVIMGRVPNALVVNPKIKANTVAEFIADAKARPGHDHRRRRKATAARRISPPSCSRSTAEVKFQHVPYRGSAPALQDLVAGSVDIMFDNLGVSLALVKGGKLKLIAVATPKRMASLARRADDRRDAAGLRIVGLVRRCGAAQDAAGDRRQDQRRRQRSAAGSRYRPAPACSSRPSRSAARRKRPPPICARRSTAGTR